MTATFNLTFYCEINTNSYSNGVFKTKTTKIIWVPGHSKVGGLKRETKETERKHLN